MFTRLSRIVLATVLTFGPLRTGVHALSQSVRSRTNTPQSAERTRVEEKHASVKREVVFLLHGIGKGRFDMHVLHRSLLKQGFEVVNWEYPSTKHELGSLADKLNVAVRKHKKQKVHFVTHSMGGIVVRTYLAKYQPQNVGRLVMIAPPNQGAYLADLLCNLLPYKLMLGPAGQQLCQGEKGGCSSAGTPCCEFGIIAGGLGTRIGMNPLVPGDNDGTVSVEGTRLEGASDFVVLPYAHPVIQMMPRTIRNVASFLQEGKFSDKAAESKKKAEGE